jgi:hypothetical protein
MTRTVVSNHGQMPDHERARRMKRDDRRINKVKHHQVDRIVY